MKLLGQSGMLILHKYAWYHLIVCQYVRASSGSQLNQSHKYVPLLHGHVTMCARTEWAHTHTHTRERITISGVTLWMLCIQHSDRHFAINGSGWRAVESECDSVFFYWCLACECECCVCVLWMCRLCVLVTYLCVTGFSVHANRMHAYRVAYMSRRLNT